jgi:hypothetical protein
MHCFVHTDREALGICKSCYKGLCAECAADLQHSLACRAKHEETVERLHSMVSRAQRVQSTAQFARYLAPAFTGILGLVFVINGFVLDRTRGFLFPIGLAFLLYTVAIFAVRRRACGTRQAGS